MDLVTPSRRIEPYREVNQHPQRKYLKTIQLVSVSDNGVVQFFLFALLGDAWHLSYCSHHSVRQYHRSVPPTSSLHIPSLYINSSVTFSTYTSHWNSYQIMSTRLTHLLLSQLLEAWNPGPSARSERIKVHLSKTPKLSTPPLVVMLADLADVPIIAQDPDGKILPCGHRIDVRSIFSCANLFGDQIWGRKPIFLECPHHGCNKQHTIPMIPNAGVVDGLKARLDLLQWSWAHGKDTPDNGDVKLGSTLRYILEQIGHVIPTNEPKSKLSKGAKNPRRLKEMLRLFDTKCVAQAIEKLYASPERSRGAEPYCGFRPSGRVRPGQQRIGYHTPSPGQFCECDKPHMTIRKPNDWASTPAEDGGERKDEVVRMGGKAGKSKQKKSVRFAAPVVTKIHYFEPWWLKEFYYSTRYYSSGPSRITADPSTKEDDDREIARLDQKISATEGSKPKRRLPWQ